MFPQSGWVGVTHASYFTSCCCSFFLTRSLVYDLQDEFKGTELGELAAALLRGYGWTEGKVLGRNKNREDTKIVDFQKRSGSYGLGFNPSTVDPKKNRSGDWILPDSGAQERSKKDNGKEREAERNRREEDLPRERIGSRQRKVENGDVRDERVGSRKKDEGE